MAKANTISVTAVPGEKISVGINYPWAWNQYGLYFGSGVSVPGDAPALDAWLPNLDRNLGTIKDCISVVRIFLFCNFNNLGTTQAGTGPVSPWRTFVPPTTVSPIYADQLDKMLKIFNKHEMKVIPCLTDFPGFAQGIDPNTGAQRAGKSDIITDPTMTSWFIENVAKPLIAVSANGDNAKAVFAWDAMNEPGQVTDSIQFKYLKKSTFAIPNSQMTSFLQKIIDCVHEKGLKATVGHHFAGDLDDLPTGDIRQFHYYPQHYNYTGYTGGEWWKNLVVPTDLPPFRKLVGKYAIVGTKAFIGEFQSGYAQPDQRHAVTWPEIPDKDQVGATSRMVTRLNLIEQKGYGLALLWPDDPPPAVGFDPANPSDERLKVSKEVLDGVRAYLKQ
jgi:hypothetical protein